MLGVHSIDYYSQTNNTASIDIVREGWDQEVDARAQDTGRLALAVGAVACGSAVCLATYFVVGGPFGTINDMGNAATGVLSGWLAWRLRRPPDGGTDIATAAALVGATLTVAGSALVITGTTGWLYAGMVSGLGFAGIGTWLVLLNRSVRGQAAAWSPRLRTLGVIAGGLMAIGVATAPGILLGLDDVATAPAWIWVGFVSWLGIYVAYPAWAISMGIVEGGFAGRERKGPTETAVIE